MDDIKLSDAIRLMEVLKPKKQKHTEIHLGWNIVVLQRGWVVVGNLFKNGQYFTLKNPAVIRVWGTTQGLPELVDGPLSGTKLDRAKKDFHFHELTVVFFLEVSNAWEKTLL